MCHIVPIVIFWADLKVFSYIVSHYLYVYAKCFVSHHSYLCGVEVITHAHIEVITHAGTMLPVFYTVAVVNIGCCEGKNCGRLVAAAFETVVLAF